jgi:hypothetical protein
MFTVFAPQIARDSAQYRWLVVNCNNYRLFHLPQGQMVARAVPPLTVLHTEQLMRWAPFPLRNRLARSAEAYQERVVSC